MKKEGSESDATGETAVPDRRPAAIAAAVEDEDCTPLPAAAPAYSGMLANWREYEGRP